MGSGKTFQATQTGSKISTVNSQKPADATAGTNNTTANNSSSADNKSAEVVTNNNKVAGTTTNNNGGIGSENARAHAAISAKQSSTGQVTEDHQYNSVNSGTADNVKQVPGLKDLPALEQQVARTEEIAKGKVYSPSAPVNSTSTAESVNSNAGAEKDNATQPDAVAQNNPPVGKTSPDQQLKPGTGGGKTQPMVTVHKVKRLYIGAFVAPDFSTIKYQPGSKVGFNLGGVIGYNFFKKS